MADAMHGNLSDDDLDAGARRAWRFGIIRRSTDLYGEAIEALATDDNAHINVCMREVAEMCDRAERAGLLTPNEARQLRRGWLIDFAERCVATMKPDELRALSEDPNGVFRFLPLKRQLQIMRSGYVAR